MSKTLSVPLNAVPSDFDPQTMSDIYSMIANLQLHRGLLKFNSNLDVEPDLAESFTVLDNGKTVVFTLRKNAIFTDGSPVLSKDVINTFKRMFKLKTAMASDLSYLEGSESSEKLKIKQIDERKLSFHLKYPCSLLLKQLATVDSSILKLNDILERIPNIYSGPYKLLHSGDKEVELSLNDKLKFPKAPTSVRFLLHDPKVSDSNSLKKYDSIDGLVISENIIHELKKEGWNEVVSTTANIFALVINTHKVKMSDVEKIFEFFYYEKDYIDKSNFVPVYTIVPPAISQSATNFNLKRKKTVKEKSQKIFNLLVVKGGVGVEMLKSPIAAFKRKNNIKINIVELPVAEFLEKVKSNNFDIRLLPKLIDYPDPYAMLSYFRSGYEANRFFVNDKAIDALLDQSIAETDKNKRNKINDEIQTRILEKKVFVPLFSGTTQAKLWSGRVAKVPAHPMGLISLPFEKIEMK